MPRQIQTEAPRNVTPDSQGQIDTSLPVTAPLLVQQPRTSAQNLSDALDAFMPVVKTAVGKWEDANAAQAETDAANNKEDQWLFKNSPAYHRNFLQQTTQARWNQAKQAIAQNVQDQVEQNPHATLDDVNKMLDEGMATFTYGADGKPRGGMDEADVVKAITPQMAQFRAQMLASAGSYLKDRTDTHFIEAATINANDAYQQSGQLDWNSVHDSMVQAVGGQKANQALSQMAATLADRYADPNIIKSLPEKWTDGTPGLMSTQYGHVLVNAQDAAESKQRQQGAQQFDQEKTLFLKRLDDLQQAGQTVPFSALLAKDKAGRQYLGPEEALSQYHALQDAANQQANVRIAGQLLSEGNGSARLAVGQGVGSGITPDILQRAADQTIAALPQNQQMQAAWKYAQSDGVAYTPLKQLLSFPTLQNPQVFAQQLQAFKAMQAGNPGVVHVFMDEKTEATYRAAASLDDGTRTPEQIATILNNRDPKDAAKISEWQKQVGAQLSNVEVGRKWLWNIRGRNADDIKNPGTVMHDLAARTSDLLQTGAYQSPDAAIADAAKQLSGRYIYVDGYALRKIEGMPDPDTFAKAWESYEQNQLPGMLKGTNAKPADVELRADGRTDRDNDTLGIYYKGTFTPATDQRVPFASIMQSYGVTQSQAAAAQVAKEKALAEQRARDAVEVQKQEAARRAATAAALDALSTRRKF